VLGAEEFDRRLGSFFLKYRATGSTTEQFVTSLTDGSANDLGPLFRDWLFTTGWAERLSSGQSLQAIVESYKTTGRTNVSEEHHHDPHT
jgi:aminopeptidase N